MYGVVFSWLRYISSILCLCLRCEVQQKASVRFKFPVDCQSLFVSGSRGAVLEDGRVAEVRGNCKYCQENERNKNENFDNLRSVSILRLIFELFMGIEVWWGGGETVFGISLPLFQNDWWVVASQIFAGEEGIEGTSSLDRVLIVVWHCHVYLGHW